MPEENERSGPPSASPSGDRARFDLAGDRMRELREGIESLMDADALVPADGGALLVLVDVAATCLRAGDLATSSHYLEALVALLTVFDARGPRGRAGDHAPIDDARALLEHCRAARRLRPVNDRPAEE